MTFGEKVYARRREFGWTQQELADKLGVSRRMIIGYESDAIHPRTRDRYNKLAEILDVRPGYLLSDDEDFLLRAGEEFGNRGRSGAEKILSEVTGLFAGGEMAEEDMDELMLAIQVAYIDAKRKNKRFSAKKAADVSDCAPADTAPDVPAAE